MLGKSFRIGSLLLLPAVAVTVLALYLGGAVPYRVYVIHTGSMSPAIPSRSAVVVRDGRYHVGQVVTFHENGTLVTHRLVAIHPDGTVDTKGDADRSIDPWHIRTRRSSAASCWRRTWSASRSSTCARRSAPPRSCSRCCSSGRRSGSQSLAKGETGRGLTSENPFPGPTRPPNEGGE